jgi:hypothetical protein
MSKVINAESKLVTRTVETRKAGKRVRGEKLPPPDSIVESTVDFNGCTIEQVYDLAERAVVISQQQKLRKSTDPADWAVKVWNLDAVTFLRAERSTDPMEDARRALARLTPEMRKLVMDEQKARSNNRA